LIALIDPFEKCAALDAAFLRLLQSRRVETAHPAICTALGSLRSWHAQGVHEKAPVERLARGCDVTVRHLRRLFREHVGVSPKQFDVLRRVNQAIAALSAGSPTRLSRLAIELGFTDYTHFSHTFRRHTLISPVEYVGSIRHREDRMLQQDPAGP
jgi:transcriptional regulator GlxA family with amidase domain